jgi:hypothetical protein
MAESFEINLACRSSANGRQVKNAHDPACLDKPHRGAR